MAARYPDPVFDVRATPEGVVGVVGVGAQAQAVRARIGARWPDLAVRLHVLADRRPRRACWPQVEPLSVWRGRPGPGGAGASLTTELLAGDPPAELLAVRGAALLVRAPGQAVGWVDRAAPFRLGPPGDPGRLGLTPVLPGAWSPSPAWPQVLDFVVAQVGRPYVWGATGGRGFDCSGLVWRALLRVGLLLPRNSRGQRACGARVAPAAVDAGDLAGALSRGRRVSHVALALDAERVVHACSETGAVRVEPRRTFEQRYQVLGWRRLGGDGAQPAD